MDDPDVDLELIALLRQSLGISNKGEDTVSCETGKKAFFSQTQSPMWRLFIANQPTLRDF